MKTRVLDRRLRHLPGVSRLIALVAFALALLPARAHAQQAAFVARTDRAEVTLGEVLTLEITLSLGEGRADGYMPPTFEGFRILGEYPSQSTQIQIVGGQSITRNIYSWRYELAPTQSGKQVITPAKVRAGGRELKTAPIPVTVHSGALTPGGRTGAAANQPLGGGAQSPQRRRQRVPRLGSPFDDLFGAPEPEEPVAQGGGGKHFIQVTADKTKAYVGEQIVVEWALFLAERQDRYQSVTEARTDGFWSEDLAGPTAGNLSLTQQMYEGRPYLHALLSRRALFPLQPGTLTITPLESDISQADFFGRTARTQRLRAEPLNIEVIPLPTAGKPANFDPAAVGRFSIEAKVDRTEVTVGEPVSLVVTVSGQGNLRKLAPPRLGALDGWKLYEPKTDVKIENQGGISGRKTVEYLMQSERAGTTIVPAFELTYFDPAARRYVTDKTPPIRLVAKGDPNAPRAALPGRPATAGETAAGVENVIGAELRPPRSRAQLGRDLGTTLYRSTAFSWAVILPPVAFGLTVLVERVRRSLGRDTESARRRKTRKRVKGHLRAAEKALGSGSPTAFYAEIDRVVRELLTARLGQPVAGHSRDELPGLITSSGLPPAVATRIVAILEECDRARFAPGSISADQLGEALERAEELIPLIEKAPQRRKTSAEDRV